MLTMDEREREGEEKAMTHLRHDIKAFPSRHHQHAAAVVAATITTTLYLLLLPALPTHTHTLITTTTMETGTLSSRGHTRHTDSSGNTTPTITTIGPLPLPYPIPSLLSTWS